MKPAKLFRIHSGFIPTVLYVLTCSAVTAQVPDTTQLQSDKQVRQRLTFAIARAREVQASAIALEAHIKVTYDAVHARIVRDSLRALGTQPPVVVPPPDTTTPPLPGPSSMNFNSTECSPTDPNLLFCDDFEDGHWYEKNGDQALGSGGLLQTDGWGGGIFAEALRLAGTARCGNAGYRSNCAATSGNRQGTTTGNGAEHALLATGNGTNGVGVDEIYVRFYIKTLAGYQYGAEKILTFNNTGLGVGGIYWGNWSFWCGSGTLRADGWITMGMNSLVGPDPGPTPGSCWTQNLGNSLDVVPDHWYFVEIHFKLNTPGQSNAVWEMWLDDCTNAGSCTGTPTLRMRMANFSTYRSGPSDQIRSLWFEAWSNPSSRGERLMDQIKVSRAPIGFMR